MQLRPMLFLLLAVATEIVGVTAMKLVADQQSALSVIFMYSMIALSFYLLSFVVVSVPMGLAYALWEAAGMTAITVIGYLVFAERMNGYKIGGIIMLIAGVVIVKLAAPDEDGAPAVATVPPAPAVPVPASEPFMPLQSVAAAISAAGNEATAGGKTDA